MAMYGYARVSSILQKEDRQVIALRDFGVKPPDIIVEKMSGKDFGSRPLFQGLLRRLKSGDTLVVKSIDRLGRNYHEIIEYWRYITKETKAAIVVMDMPLLDTREKGRDLTAEFISDLVLQLLSYVAEAEREFNLSRQAEGIAVAKAKGVRFGRPNRAVPDNFDIMVAEWEAKRISFDELLKETGLKPTTFYKMLREYRHCLQTGQGGV